MMRNLTMLNRKKLITEPKISVIVANYNHSNYIIDCLESVKIQTEENWECIIIDDCSTDESNNIISQYVKADYRFKHIRNSKNLGYQKCLILGINHSSAPLFGRLDADDVLETEALSIMCDEMDNNENLGLIYSNLFICDEKLNIINEQKSKQILKDSPDFFNFHGEISHFAVFRRCFYNKTSGIDIMNLRAEDKDIYMKMLEVSESKHINSPLYYYRCHGMNVSLGGNIERAEFWHWVSIIKMAERNHLNVEDLFVNYYIRRSQCDKKLLKGYRIRKNIIAKILLKLKLIEII